MKFKCLRGMGMGWGHFSPPKLLLLTFIVIKISHFCLSAKIEGKHDELITLTQVGDLALSLVGWEASRTLGQVGGVIFLEGGELKTYLGAFLRGFGCSPNL